MVTFEKIEDHDDIVYYYYYPEDDRSKKPGLIKIDEAEQTIGVEEPAERDFKCHESAESFNKMVDYLNQLRLENGEEPEEPDYIDHDMEWWYYADHAITTINHELDEKGKLPERGVSAWY